MNKKLIIGIGVLGLVGYFIWKQNQEKNNFTHGRKLNCCGS
jgi:hypothetical protein